MDLNNPASMYQFVPNNPFLDQPIEFLLDKSKHTTLTESILALEAAAQKDGK